MAKTKIMNIRSKSTLFVERRPLVVEVVGAAGAGKTTLLRALSQRNNNILSGVHLPRIRYIPFLANITLVLLPTFLLHYRHSRWFTWEETRSMIYLKAWHHVLGQHAPHHSMMTVLDHGPIFRLALLREFGPEIITSQVYMRWWESALNQWAATLDMVIWLDAPDAILIERIRSRDRWHSIKDKSEDEAFTFLARYRTSYEQIISQLTTPSGPKVLRFDTNRESPDQIAVKILDAFESEHSALL